VRLRLTLLALLLVALVAASSSPSAAASCARRSAASTACVGAGEARPGGPPIAKASPTPQGIDISNWQGVPNFHAARAAGLRFVIIQTNDGFFRNPFFWLQAAAANNAGIPWGTYTFIEGADPVGQAQIALSMAAGHGRKLGVWADAEKSAAYPVTCAYVRHVQAAGVHIYGVYGSPGTYRGGRCPGWDWPAIWFGPARPLPGYPASATKLHQWCGTCHVPWYGGELDRDESLGLLSLAAPAPTRAQLRAKAVREAGVLLADLHRHGCFHVHGRHAYPLCPRWGQLWRHWQHEAHRLST
jgi:hypothetical protein